MRNRAFIAGLALVICFASASSVLACHSNYFNEIFTKIKSLRNKGDLEKDQIEALWAMKADFDKVQRQYNREGRRNSALDPHVNAFVAAAAGILDSEQFTYATKKKKTEAQELRYEVNQLKKELAEIKALLKELKK